MNELIELAIGCLLVLIVMVAWDIWKVRRERELWRDFVFRQHDRAQEIVRLEQERKEVAAERARQHPGDRAAAIAAFKAHGERAQQEKDNARTE